MVRADAKDTTPDNSAARAALWRAMHKQIDAAPHVLEDEIGLQMVNPEGGWRERPDMYPEGTKLFRASIVARARFIEDLVTEQTRRGLRQYVILGAGLDTFAQRKPEIASLLSVFEVDQPATQTWKRQRLIELGIGVSRWLTFVPVDFECGDSWWQRLVDAGFRGDQPAFVASTGVSMYLTRDAITAMLRQVVALAPGSILAMTFLVPLELADPEVRSGLQMAEKGARASGTPFLSFFTPAEMMRLAREAGFRKVQHVSGTDPAQRYFSDRVDHLRPPNPAEEILVASV
jgi:methyltransferase (TIGR00027 family)